MVDWTGGTTAGVGVVGEEMTRIEVGVMKVGEAAGVEKVVAAWTGTVVGATTEEEERATEVVVGKGRNSVPRV